MTEQLVLEDLLRQLQGEGQMHSSGAFTMDMERAAPKLRRFLLQNPFHYALKLIQAGVAAGAERIDIESGDKNVTIHLRGARIPSSQLPHVFHFLLEAQPDCGNRALRHLAIGLNGLVSLGAYRIRLTGWDGQEGYRGVWTSGGLQADSFSPRRDSAPFVRLEVVRKLRDRAQGLWTKLNRDVYAVATARRSSMDREQACIVDRCFCCPVPLGINGRWVNRAYSSGTLRRPDAAESRRLNEAEDLAVLEVPLSDGKASGLRKPGPWRAPLVFAHGSASESTNLPLLASLLLGTQWLTHSHLIILEDGVLLGQQEVYLGRPAVTALMCGSLFTRDLTGLAVTRDAYYLRNQAALIGWAEELRSHTYADWDLIPKPTLAALETWGASSSQLLTPRVKRLLFPGREPRR